MNHAPMDSSKPIGVFDSGLGGLTVLKGLRESIPSENFIYLGDTARLPYGAKSPETIARYAQQNIDFLCSRGVKAVVVACNSASSALHRVRIPQGIFVTGVIKPSAQIAAQISTSARIGVIGTTATITSNAYPEALNAVNEEIEVFQVATPLLVPLVEEGWLDDPLTNLVLHRYLQPLFAKGIDTLILGCTHYPTLRDSIQRIAGQQISIVESTRAMQLELHQAVSRGELSLNPQPGPGDLQILATDRSPSFAQLTKQLLGEVKPPKIEIVDLNQSPRS